MLVNDAGRDREARRSSATSRLIISLLLTAVAGGTVSAQPRVRVVPNLGCEVQRGEEAPLGVIDPTGRFAAHFSTERYAVLVIDLQRNRVAWILPVPYPWAPASGLAFSPDGAKLAVSRPAGGLLLDLKADRVESVPWLHGEVVAFSPDGRHIWQAVANDSSSHWKAVESLVGNYLHCMTLKGVRVSVLPLEMNVPGTIRFSNDGATMTVTGNIGSQLMNRGGGTLQAVTQTIELKSERSKTSLQPLRSSFNPPPVRKFFGLDLLPIDDQHAFRQSFYRLFWHEGTGRFVVHDIGPSGYGKPKVWHPLVQARFQHTFTGGWCHGFDHDGNLLAFERYELEDLPKHTASAEPVLPEALSVEVLTRIDPATAKKTPLLIADHSHLVPSPDGRFLATDDRSITRAARNSASGRGRVVRIWRLENPRLLAEIDLGGRRVKSMQWSRDGARLGVLILHDNWAGCSLQVWTPEGKLEHRLPSPSCRMDLSPDGSTAVFETEGKGDNGAAIVVVEIATGKKLGRYGETSASVAAEKFIDSDTVVVGRRQRDPPTLMIVRFDLPDKKPKWSARGRGHLQRFLHRPGTTHVVAEYQSGADIVALKTGKLLPTHRAGDRTFSWFRPTLAGDGSLVLDSVNKTSIVRLAETATDQTIATFAAFADPEWMVWTPDGLWTGSEKALNWVSFYRGTYALTRDEILQRRDAEEIRKRIRDALTRMRNESR